MLLCNKLRRLIGLDALCPPIMCVFSFVIQSALKYPLERYFVHKNIILTF